LTTNDVSWAGRPAALRTRPSHWCDRDKTPEPPMEICRWYRFPIMAVGGRWGLRQTPGVPARPA
jgi:hypothetical protein